LHHPINVWDHYQRERLVSSSGALIGLMAADAGQPLPRNRLLAFLPSGSAGDSLCVFLETEDGRFEAKYQYARREITTPVALLNITPQRYPRQFAEYAVTQVAARAYVDRTCSGTDRRYVAVSWTNQRRPQHLLALVLVEQGMTAEATLRIPGRVVPALPCNSLRGENFHEYNRQCTVSIPLSPGIYDFHLNYGYMGDPMRPKIYRVALP
jgi:hypothetical protein